MSSLPVNSIIYTDAFRHAFEYQMRRRSTIIGNMPPKMQTQVFNDEHSLQGQYGKTHGVC